jgi:2-polyprenyl-3-methyl-5-hydroxy-6-metoxy-1,4-benzoquinol methylase
VLEIGCGASQVLPFLARRKQAVVWGIDYAPAGVKEAERGLAAEEVEGTIVLGDALKDNNLPKNFFDAVLTMGVIEHFPPPENTAVMAKFATYARPGGQVITLIPNLLGLIGWLMRLLDNPLYKQHVLLNKVELDDLHLQAGLQPIATAAYLGGFSIYVLNHIRLKEHLPAPVHWLVLKSGGAFGRVVQHVLPGREVPFLSPYLVCTYKKPDQAANNL